MSNTRTKKRSRSGQNQLEFAAIFGVLIIFVLVPLIDLAAIPIRMAFADSAVKDAVHNLALSSKFSQALSTLGSGTLLQPRLKAISGVDLVTAKLSLTATGSNGESPVFDSPGSVPKIWLPDGEGKPYHYNLVLGTEMDISPLFLLNSGFGDIPGLTQPFRAKISESYAWENLSKDPETSEFFLNE